MKLIEYEKYSKVEKRKWYEKIELYLDDDNKTVVKKPPFETMRQTYLNEWKVPKENETLPSPLPVPYKLYGLHRHGGYHGFFKPDLDEVISLLIESPITLDSFEKAYIHTFLVSEELVYFGDNECQQGCTFVYLSETGMTLSPEQKILNELNGQSLYELAKNIIISRNVNVCYIPSHVKEYNQDWRFYVVDDNKVQKYSTLYNDLVKSKELFRIDDNVLRFGELSYDYLMIRVKTTEKKDSNKETDIDLDTDNLVKEMKSLIKKVETLIKKKE